MTTPIDYYFTSLSPFTYLGHNALLALANKHGAAIHYQPIKLAKVFAELGVLPVTQRAPSRQAYRLVELGRWSKKRNLPLNLQPAFFPADPSLADKCIIVLQQSGQNAAEFLGQVLAACWAQERNIADEAVIEQILASLNADAKGVLQQTKSTDIEAIYQANTAAAIEKGILGVPAYMFNNEQFWGQDRLELLDDALNR